MSILTPHALTRRGNYWSILQSTLPRRATDLIALAKAWKLGLITTRERQMMDFFVTVGTQRTGTNILREVLCTNPEVGFRGEVFSPGTESFDVFAAANGFTRPTGYPEAERQILGFIKHLHAQMPPSVRAYGFDVKYSQLRAITPTYEPLCSLPALVQFLKSSGTRVIHVVRENVLQSALSEMVATARAVWHHHGDERIETKITIDCRELLRIMLEKRADRQIFTSVMEGHGRMITCEYDRLVRGLAMRDSDGRLIGNDNPLFEIADFLGVKPAFREPNTLKKIAQGPYSDLIENYDEIIKIVRRTEFVTYIDTI